MHKNGVKFKTGAPFKPSSNGQAERYVATLKQSLRAMHKYEGTIRQKLSTFLMQYRKAPNVTTTLSPAMLFLKIDIRTRIDLLLSELKTKIQDKLRRDNFEFRDRKFDVGDRVAVRVYRAANTRWKFGTIVNQDGVLHYIIEVQGTLVRRHVDQIRPVGDKVQENIIPLIHQRFPSAEVRENNSNTQHAETAGDISKDLNKELGSSSVQGGPSTDVRFQLYHSLQLKRLTPKRGVHQFQTGHFLGVLGESGDLRRDLFFKEGDVVYLTATMIVLTMKYLQGAWKLRAKEVVEPPSLEEFIDAINELKDHKAPGPDAIPSELLKKGGKETYNKVYDLIQAI
ncbi:transposon Tf2-9 polyprotein [Trichonephila clavipes]|nr:transposon Tf2-9 polyprotein [Trichonephila clavipes]